MTMLDRVKRLEQATTSSVDIATILIAGRTAAHSRQGGAARRPLEGPDLCGLSRKEAEILNAARRRAWPQDFKD